MSVYRANGALAIVPTFIEEVGVVYRADGVLAIVPAYNEEEGLACALDSLIGQSVPPAAIIVVVNNSTDGTLAVAERYDGWRGVHVINLPDNPHLKAGALNAGLRAATRGGRLPPSIAYVMVMDGDTELDEHFIRNSLQVMRAKPALGGLSASCLGKRGLGRTRWQRLLAFFQEVEYARQRTARFRQNVHTMSGAGSFYRATAVQQLLDRQGYLFLEDHRNLVEDYHTTLDLKEAGWWVTSNHHCVAYTDLMLSVRALLRQRTRWVRGTIDELRRRGWNRHTRSSIVALLVGLLGMFVMAGWIGYGVTRMARNFDPNWSWLIWAMLWPLYQAWCVRSLGWRALCLELLILPELAFGVLRWCWLIQSVVLSYSARAQTWE